MATGASVHRRGRCIGVSLPLRMIRAFFSLVLVCLSVDVTGALALPNSFCFGYLHVLHAPPPICPFCHLALLWSGVGCLSSAVSMLSSPLLSSLCVFARGARWVLSLFVLAPRARRPFLFCVLLSFLVRVSVFPCCLLSLVVSCLLSSCLPCPAVSLCCVLVQLTFSCWVYGPALFSFRHSVHGNKGFLPCVGFFTLYTMLLVTSGSLVRPYRGIHRDDDPDTS